MLKNSRNNKFSMYEAVSSNNSFIHSKSMTHNFPVFPRVVNFCFTVGGSHIVVYCTPTIEGESY